MSTLSRSTVLFSLVRCIRKQQRFLCVEALNHIKTAQFTAARGRDARLCSTRYFPDWETKHPWTLYQRRLFSEAPHNGDEYPPLAEYILNAEEQENISQMPQAKEVYIIQVKGLPFSCTAEDLMSFFCDCRIRDGVHGIHIIYNRLGRPTGQAFIELEHVEDICKALSKQRHYLRDRYIIVNEVTNKEAEAILKAKKQIMESDGTVRLRGLPFGATKEDIIEFFSGLEIVKDGITLVVNKRGRSTGDAFVQFASKEIAEIALKKDRECIGTRYIEIFPCRGSDIQDQYGNRQNQIPGTVNSSAKTGTKNIIHMKGLPYNVNGEDIAKFFAPIRFVKVLIEYGSNGRVTGEAEAYFATHQDAVLAMSKDREYILNRYIELYLNSCPSEEEKQNQSKLM